MIIMNIQKKLFSYFSAPFIGRIVLCVCAGIFLCMNSAFSLDYYVSPNGSNVTGDGSLSKPWQTIGQAISSSVASQADPARIHIARGAYSETLVLNDYNELYGGYEDPGWSRSITSYRTIIQPPSAASSTPVILAGTGSRLDGLYLQNGKIGIKCADSPCVIAYCNVTLMSITGIYINGASASPEILNNTLTYNKEGIYISQADAPVIRNNTIKYNTGNAITAQNCDLDVEFNILRENSLAGLNLSSVSGDIFSNEILRNNTYGINFSQGAPVVVNNRIAFNLTAGISCKNSSLSRILFNTLYLNGDGIILKSSSPEIANNISFRNNYYGIQESYTDSDPTLRNNCLWENGWGNYKDEGAAVYWTTQEFATLIDNNGAPVQGNFAEDPSLADVAHENFHLSPFSPCIDRAYSIPEITGDFEGTHRLSTTQDVGADEYSDAFTYTFESGNEGWIVVGALGVFTLPEYAAENGALMLRSKDSNTFGFWESPEGAIPIFENYLYHSTWRVSTDVPTQALVPGLRLRFNEEDSQMGAEMLLNSNLNGDCSPTPDGVLYDFYYRPLQGSPLKQEKAGNVLCAFDLINLGAGNQDNGALFLENLTLEWTSLTALDDRFTTVSIFDFEGSSLGWEFRSVPSAFDPPVNEIGAHYLILRSAGSNTFGYWESPPQPVDSDALYRVRFFVSTDVSLRSKVPMLRLRVNSVINQSSQLVWVDSSTNGDSSPIPNQWSCYELYYIPSAPVEANGVLIAFDLANFNPNDSSTGALYLDRVEVHAIPLPLF